MEQPGPNRLDLATPQVRTTMSTPDEYRQYADECLRAIWTARVPEIRALLLSMAKRWMDLAERAEREANSRPPLQTSPDPIEEKKPPAPSISRQSRRARNAETG